jgi:release factor glutamine methyltransferase
MELKDYSETIPVQYEEGKTVFMGMDITVDPRVLIPRPETELLVRTAAEGCRLTGVRAPRVLDIGTGSGCIAIALTRLLPNSRIIAADISPDALDVARVNADALAEGGRIELIRSDMFSALQGEGYEGCFDLIVSNPPYVSDADYARVDAWVRAEPGLALRGGTEGMDLLAAIAENAPLYLAPGGLLAVEAGYDQAEKVKESFNGSGLEEVRSVTDLNGYERVITGRKSG